MLRRTLVWSAIALAATHWSTSTARAQGAPASAASPTPSASDTIVGRVTSSAGGAPVSGATVFVTRGPDRLVQQDTTDADGRWQLVFTPGTGDYLVFISAPDAQPYRKRLTRSNAAQRIVADAVLQKTGPSQLAAVRVRANAPKPEPPNRTSAEPTVGSNERVVEGVYAAVSPGAAGDPMAAAGTIPGLNVGANGVSALGAGGDQSLTTLNGLASGARLPREAATRTRGSLSSFDPSVGGFSGALVAQELDPGSMNTRKSGSFTLDAPALRNDDALARAYGMQPTSLQASMGRSGMLVDDRVFYTAAAQAVRRSAGQSSLFTAPSELLRLQGIGANALAQLQSGFGAAKVPFGLATPNEVNESVNLVAQLDRTPRGRRALRVTGLLDASRTSGAGISASTLTSAGYRTQDVRSAIQVGQVSLSGGTLPVLNDFRTSLSGQFSSRTPTLLLPAGVVRAPDVTVDASADDLNATGAVPTIRFGGDAGARGDSRTVSWEAADDVTWLHGGRRHLFKLHAWTRVDATADETVSNPLGTYSYNTLADLQANRPASYTRTVSQPARSGAAWNSAAAFAHRWAPSRVFQLLWGARAEANRYVGTPAANPALLSALGVATNRVPSSIGISPRLGMTWYLVKERAGGFMTNANDYAIRSTLPVGMLRAGVGEFRGLYRANALADADGATGASDALRRLTCVGSAVPLPDWSSMNSSATSCAPGAPSLTDAGTPISTFTRNYTPPRSWRGNVGWTSRWWIIDYRADATYALNLNQPSVQDLNFSGVQSATLPAEAGRAVYFRPTDVDARTGAVSALGSRRSSAFGAVSERMSDLRGRAGQLTLSLTPDLSGLGRSFGGDYVNFNYTYASARTQARGFDAGAAGDPRRVEWGRSPFDVRHQIMAQFAKYVAPGVGLSMFLRLESGRPFTPMVASDINGDGRANDRAFVPMSSSLLSSSFTPFDVLLASAPKSVARCLRAQRGTIAAMNSCEGPWTQSMQLRLDLAGARLKLPDRARVAVQFVNPLGALDRALHGSNELRGWGTAAAPDNVLLVPRGFTSASNAFTYDVNPRFGETRPSRTARPLEPYGATIDVRINFSERDEVQQLRRQLRPGRGGDRRARLTTDTLMARYQRAMPSLFVSLQAYSDTLLLTPAQLDSLTSREMRYRAQLAEVFKPLVEHLAALPDRYDAKDAQKRAARTDSLAWDITYETGALAKAVLTPVQLSIVPRFIRNLLTEDPSSLRRDHARYSIDASPQGTSFSMSRN